MPVRHPRRPIVLVDVEDALGAPEVHQDAVGAFMSRLTSMFGAATQYVLAASHSRNALEIGLACPGRRVIWLPGTDGVDRALQTEIIHPTTLRRFDHVVLVSGDGGFAPSIAAAASAGVMTTIVSRVDALSPKLRLAAHSVIAFDDATDIIEVA